MSIYVRHLSVLIDTRITKPDPIHIQLCKLVTRMKERCDRYGRLRISKLCIEEFTVPAYEPPLDTLKASRLGDYLEPGFFNPKLIS